MFSLARAKKNIRFSSFLVDKVDNPVYKSLFHAFPVPSHMWKTFGVRKGHLLVLRPSICFERYEIVHFCFRHILSSGKHHSLNEAIIMKTALIF